MLALVEQHRAVAEALHRTHVVGHEQDRAALALESLELVEALLLEAGVPDRQHLVDQQDLRVDLDRHREGEAHVHPRGVVLQAHVEEVLELREGDDVVEALAGLLAVTVPGTRVAEGLTVGEGSSIDGVESLEGPVWIGRDVAIGAGARLTGPLAIGDGARVGAGAALRESIVFPGGEVAPRALLIGAIAGSIDFASRLRPRGS